jgi:hypothetical protein
MSADKDNSEVSIKLKDCKEKILAIVTITIIGVDNDERYNDRFLVESEK